MQAGVVTLENVGKRYGEQWVVRNIDLHVERGAFFTLLGPSGCGKTTLLRMIAGFAEPDEGCVRIDGHTVNHVPPWRRGIGLVFQSYALWPHLTVFENIAFGLRERKFPAEEIVRRVRAALDQVALTGTEDRRPSQLSGGQQQRVALARTLVIQPRVLLLDEPLSNLDAKLRIEMRLELQKLQRELDLTTLYVTHDQEEALALSTHIAVINQGRIVQQGAPRAIYEMPANDFVAGFIGQANLLPATIEPDGSLRLIDNGVILQMPMGVPSNGVLSRPGERVKLSIRPEALRLIECDDQSTNEPRIPGRVVASAYQGAFVEYELVAANRTFKARLNNPKGKPLFATGDEVQLTFAIEDLVILPKDVD